MRLHMWQACDGVLSRLGACTRLPQPCVAAALRALPRSVPASSNHRHVCSPPHPTACAAGADIPLDLNDWHVIDTLRTAGVRLAGLSLAVQPRWLPLPAELAALTQPTRLSLAGNSFAGGWDRLPRQLVQLDLSSCHLGHVPADLAALTQLSSLSLAHNRLAVADGLEHLPVQLRQLDLSHCSLWSVPGELSRLTQLSALCLNYNNELAGYSLYRLPQLQQLELSSCRLREVPTGVPRLTRLTELRLGDNPITDWWDLSEAEQLRRLCLQRCRLRQLPAELARLTQLTSLSLAGNPLEGGWQHLPAQLRQLDLGWCGLQQVPAELAALTQLSKLSLGRNPIAGGWQHLPAQLQHLRPSGCGQQLAAALRWVLGPALSPKVWVPAVEFVRHRRIRWTDVMYLGYVLGMVVWLICVVIEGWRKKRNNSDNS